MVTAQIISVLFVGGVKRAKIDVFGLKLGLNTISFVFAFSFRFFFLLVW